MRTQTTEEGEAVLRALTEGMFGHPGIGDVFSPCRTVEAMLAFEGALARAQAQAGLIPPEAATAISAACRTRPIDLDVLARDAVLSANTAAPLVKQLTAAVAAVNAEAAKYVHWGATSQDVLDTALVLQLREAGVLLLAELRHVERAVAGLVERHGDTTMAGRTLLQQALPITFAFKAAGWLDALMRHEDRLLGMQDEIGVLQLGGATGTLASLGEHAPAVARKVGEELHLALPDIPWHTHRDRLAAVATTCGMLAATLGKIGRDVALSSQTEVGELAEPREPGKGGSSTLPHKRNLVACNYLVAISTRMPPLVATMLAVMGQHEHERAAGAWHAEWEVLPQIVSLTGAALLHFKDMVGGLEVDAARMRWNLDLTRGQLMAEPVTLALGSRIGRMQAYALVQEACRRAAAHDLSLGEALAGEATVASLLTKAEIERLLDPACYLGQSKAFATSVLQRYTSRTG